MPLATQDLAGNRPATGREPAELAAAIERAGLVPDGPVDRFGGYAVLGVPFQSGDALALRHFPVTSQGPGYTSVWHRSPDGGWTLYSDVAANQGCSRYFGSAVRDEVTAPIRIEWTGPRSLIVAVDGGRALAWTLALRPTAATRLLNQVAVLVPRQFWKNHRVLRAMEVAARVTLRAGNVRLTGETPAGNRFVVNPRAVWLVDASRATLAGRDLGPMGSITPQPALGDVCIPRRGLFAVGAAFMSPPASTSRRIQRSA
jgi:hypothetical protein